MRPDGDPMTHRKEVCEYGRLHWQCRCPGDRPLTRVICDRPERHRPSFEPGDRVRMIYTGRHPGTVVPLALPEVRVTGVTRVDFDDEVYPRGLVVLTANLRPAGTRCIPFEAMTTDQMRDHLWLAHRSDLVVYGPDERFIMRVFHGLLHSDRDDPVPVPHTHRKATP